MLHLLESLAGAARVRTHRPWPRFVLDRPRWTTLIADLADRDWDALGLWAEGAAVHMALHDPDDGRFAVATLACPDGRYPSPGVVRPGLIRLERAIRDLHGLDAEGSPDRRPWLDHGRTPGRERELRYTFLPVEGEGLHQVPVGPVHAGIIEPGHFRFHANGETVVRLEARLGYTHKGIEALMAGRTAGEAARLATRISGDSAVAHSLAFARAVEAALEAEVPARAHWLRGLMAELERVANHLGDVGGICNDAAFPLIQAHCTVLRERVLRVAGRLFGHRLMMDRVVPGGVAVDIDEAGVRLVRELVVALRSHFAGVVRAYDNKPSLLDRTVTAGVARRELLDRFAAGGYIGRAGGRAFDARKATPYPPYDTLGFEVPTRTRSDVDARVWIRIEEVRESLSLIERILSSLPEGPVIAELPEGRAGEGVALVEGFRGDILAWVHMGADGTVLRAHARDPSWFQWPVVEAAIEGNIVADFPLCNKSFNCSYAGHDL